MRLENTVLHGLERIVNDKLFKLDAFEESLTRWCNTPLIFANRHPSLEEFEKNPAQALNQVGGRIVGRVLNARIAKQGHPRLMASIEVNDDEVESLYEQGKLSLSTGFKAEVTPSEILGSILPNHVLLFEETLYHRPRDMMALVNAESRSFVTIGSYNVVSHEWGGLTVLENITDPVKIDKPLTVGRYDMYAQSWVD